MYPHPTNNRRQSSKYSPKKSSNWIYFFRSGEEIPEHLAITRKSQDLFYIWGTSKKDILEKMRIDFKKIGFNALVDFYSKRERGNLVFYGYLAKVEPKTDKTTETVEEFVNDESVDHFDWVSNRDQSARMFEWFVKIGFLVFGSLILFGIFSH